MRTRKRNDQCATKQSNSKLNDQLIKKRLVFLNLIVFLVTLLQVNGNFAKKCHSEMKGLFHDLVAKPVVIQFAIPISRRRKERFK